MSTNSISHHMLENSVTGGPTNSREDYLEAPCTGRYIKKKHILIMIIAFLSISSSLGFFIYAIVYAVIKPRKDTVCVDRDMLLKMIQDVCNVTNVNR